MFSLAKKDVIVSFVAYKTELYDSLHSIAQMDEVIHIKCVGTLYELPKNIQFVFPCY